MDIQCYNKHLIVQIEGHGVLIYKVFLLRYVVFVQHVARVPPRSACDQL